ncbi:thioesterase family protein [Lutimaribacter marinistellae]|uniref:Thioesterase family protein n=1 Tax=Lutimaribacter marinistellae TaxID=1820329 RepID=A0ABV7THY3_9RHOB
MTDKPTGGHDGPYEAPIKVTGFTVLPEWIDYNGHMNVGFYGVAFDRALDVVMDDHLGIGAAFVAEAEQGPYVLQSHMQFLREVKEGEPFYFLYRLLDRDAKRGHYFGEMFSGVDDALCATQEALFMNVSHETGRSAAYPDWAQERMARMVADHAGLPKPQQIGQNIGIRRKA